jgi:hypothetical protein
LEIVGKQTGDHAIINAYTLSPLVIGRRPVTLLCLLCSANIRPRLKDGITFVANAVGHRNIAITLTEAEQGLALLGNWIRTW